MASQLQFVMDRSAELDAQITRALSRGLGTGEMDEGTAEILRIIASHKGAAQAVSIRQILRVMNAGLEDYALHPSAGVGWNERNVKAAVKDLIERFGIPIGGSRKPPYGYFLILTAEDQADAARPLVNELKSISRRVRSLSSKQDLARLFGQVQLELDREGSGARHQGPGRAA